MRARKRGGSPGNAAATASLTRYSQLAALDPVPDIEHQPTAGAQHTPGLAVGGHLVREEHGAELAGHGVEAFRREWELQRIGLAPSNVGGPHSRRLRSRASAGLGRWRRSRRRPAARRQGHGWRSRCRRRSRARSPEPGRRSWRRDHAHRARRSAGPGSGRRIRGSSPRTAGRFLAWHHPPKFKPLLELARQDAIVRAHPQPAVRFPASRRRPPTAGRPACKRRRRRLT